MPACWHVSPFFEEARLDKDSLLFQENFMKTIIIGSPSLESYRNTYFLEL